MYISNIFSEFFVINNQLFFIFFAFNFFISSYCLLLFLFNYLFVFICLILFFFFLDCNAEFWLVTYI